MRTNIEIDDDLLARAMALTGVRTKRSLVEEALRVMIKDVERAKAWEELKRMPQPGLWEGDLDAMRRDD